MKRVVYLTSESFLDVDISIVTAISKDIELLWIVVYSDLKRSNHHVYYPEDITNYSKEHGINCEIFVHSRRVRDFRRIGLDWTIIRSIQRFNPNVIYCDGFPDPYFPIIIKSVFGAQRVIISIHDVDLHPGSVSIFHRISHRLVMLLFKNFHLFSNSQRDLFEKLYRNKNLFVIGLFLKDFGSLVERNNTFNKVNFLFFGRDYPYKGLDVLIDAVNILLTETDNFRVTVAGDSKDFSRFDAIIKERSVYDLNLKFIDNADIPLIFSQSTFLVLPYKQVTQSGPLFIAYNYKVPVIASDLPGFAEYIEHGKTGFLFKSEDASSLAYIMKEIVLSNNERIRIIHENLDCYINERFSLDAFRKSYIDMLSSVPVQPSL